MDKLQQLSVDLRDLELRIVYYGNEDYAVGSPNFANPMFFFNNDNKGASYNGNVTFKSINMQLYNSNQIYKALKLVNEYLLGK